MPKRKSEEEVTRLQNLQGKVCPLCTVYKLRQEYEYCKSNKDLMKSYCRICRVEKDRLRRIANKKKNPIEYNYRERIRKLKLKYNITVEDYNNLLKQQDYKCKICNKPHEIGKRTNLFVDHCHTSNEVRGLLCNSCNKGLGDFKDNIIFLEKAIKYLKK